ncbi:GSCOCG00002792001-RA-CDS, partial [Cotesia congregata]
MQGRRRQKLPARRNTTPVSTVTEATRTKALSPAICSTSADSTSNTCVLFVTSDFRRAAFTNICFFIKFNIL